MMITGIQKQKKETCIKKSLLITKKAHKFFFAKHEQVENAEQRGKKKNWKGKNGSKKIIKQTKKKAGKSILS